MTPNCPQVLLVDDDKELTTLATALLSQDGISMTQAFDAGSATQLIAEKTFDLILLDLGLPDEDGFTLLENLKISGAIGNTPVVVLTAWNGVRDKVRGFDAGASDYLTKPFAGAEFRARIRSALRAKRLQEELTEANEHLKAARNAAEAEAKAKAAFLADMSHEIRTPMNGVMGMADLLLATSLSDEQRGYVDTIRQSSEALLTIINQILDYSRIEAGRIELENQEFSLRKCVEDSLDTLAMRAGEKQVDLSYEIEDDVPVCVHGDAARLRQILVNLVGNAVKFTTKGEVVVTLQLDASGGQVHFQVRDTGIGIPPEKQGKLFNAFSQAEASTVRRFGGTGLGLAISRRLVELMNGKMWLESEPGQGSVFHFQVPLRPSTDSHTTTLSRTHSPLADLRVLIVEDNPTISHQLHKLITRWGSRPEIAASPAEAIQLLEAGNTYNLALVDGTLHETQIQTLAAQLRAKTAGARTHLILISPMGTRCTSKLFAAHLTKPLKPALVRDTVLRVVSGTKTNMTKPSTPQAATLLADRFPLKVLLCEDNAVNQKVALRMLGQMGYKANVAGNGIEALNAFASQHFDLVLMDVQMPEMDGLQATAKLRRFQDSPEEHPHCQPPPIIVAMTASAMPGDRERCLKSGMDDYIAKPVRPDDLRKLVERWGQQVLQRQAPAPTIAQTNTRTETAGTSEAGLAEPLVDWERLMDLADNDQENLKELVDLYITQTERQIKQLGEAVSTSSAELVRQLAHSCAGASATLGVVRLVPILRELEARGDNGNLDGSAALFEKTRDEFVTVRHHLEMHPQGTVPMEAK